MQASTTEIYHRATWHPGTVHHIDGNRAHVTIQLHGRTIERVVHVRFVREVVAC